MATQLAISTATDNELLQAYDEAKQSSAVAKLLENKLDMEIRQRIEARGGTSLPNADENGEQIWTCEIESTFTYDQSLLVSLLELLNKTELNVCYEPAHEEVKKVEAKWIVTSLKAIARKHSLGAVEIVEKARIPKSSRLKFARI